jgi:hypothetical protein
MPSTPFWWSYPASGYLHVSYSLAQDLPMQIQVVEGHENGVLVAGSQHGLQQHPGFAAGGSW